MEDRALKKHEMLLQEFKLEIWTLREFRSERQKIENDLNRARKRARLDTTPQSSPARSRTLSQASTTDNAGRNSPVWDIESD